MYPYTEEQLAFINFSGTESVIFSAVAGSGKALTMDSLLLTPKGWVKMSEVKTGDELLTPKGEVTKITGVYPQGNKPIYKCSFSDGSSVTCCGEHLWKVQKKAKRDRKTNVYEILPLNDFKNQLYLKNGAKNYYIPLVDIEFESKNLPVNPYLLGLLLGDGSLSAKSQVGFTTNDLEIKQKVEEILVGYDCDLIPHKGSTIDYTITASGRETNSILIKLRQLGLMEKKSDGKHIPVEYLFSSKKQRIELLNGLLDSDGYVDNNSVCLTTTSRQLSTDVKHLVQSLGGVAYFTTKQPHYKYNGEKKKGLKAYVLYLCVPPQIKDQLFTLKRKKESLVTKEKSYVPYRAFESVEYIGEMECQCIEVAHEEHLYVTNDFIVTHNTQSLVGKVNKMLGDGVDPSRIIVFSFTNDAVEELKTRIVAPIRICTIHSYTSAQLGKMGKFKPIATFFDFASWYKEKYRPKAYEPIKKKIDYQNTLTKFYEDYAQISSAFSAYKLQTSDSIKVRKPKYFDEYQQYLKENKSRDFSDLLIETERLSKNPQYVDYFKGTYDYVFIDEYQDTSTLQLKILLTIEAKQYFLSGDANQCLTSGSQILTEKGYKLIEDLKVGDLIKSGVGSGRISTKKVSSIQKHNYDGELIELRTRSGKVIRTTPNHTHFAKFSTENENKFLVYLMYKRGMGYRIGKTEIYPKRNVDNNADRFGFKLRLSQEHADKLWIVESFSSLDDALIYEEYYSLKYNIPKTVFVARQTQCQERIDRLFNLIDTENGAKRLLKDIKYSVLQPHFTPQCSKANITNVFVDMCVDGRGKSPVHSLQINGQNNTIKDFFEEQGFKSTDNGKGTGWRIRKKSSDFSKIMSVINTISDSINLVMRTKLSNKMYQQLPASQVVAGMNVMIYENDTIVEDEVVERKLVVDPYSWVYDINVEETHNLIVNGVFTHNSIFGFSGANCEAIELLLKEKREVKIFNLTKNFRSRKLIVEHANHFSNLKAVPHHEEDGLVEKIMINEDRMFEMLEDGNPLTILVRTNYVIKELEKECLQRKIKMRYFNFLTPQDLELIKANKLNPTVRKKLEAVAPYYGNPERLIEFIEENFSSNVFITSIHKSKGREYPRVIVVNSFSPEQMMDIPEYLEDYSFINKHGDIDAEAMNVHYVACTRPKEELYFLMYEV